MEQRPPDEVRRRRLRGWKNQSEPHQNRLTRAPLLKRALHVIADGLRLLQNGLVYDEDNWQHLMTRAFQGYVTIRDRRWRFTIQDPTSEEMDEIMELAERKREGSN